MEPTIEPEKLLTRKEAMALLMCNSVTFWRYCRAGKIPYYRAGRKMFFKRSEILDAIRIKC
jgi:excisionase family DNA binding protein